MLRKDFVFCLTWICLALPCLTWNRKKLFQLKCRKLGQWWWWLLIRLNQHYPLSSILFILIINSEYVALYCSCCYYCCFSIRLRCVEQAGVCLCVFVFGIIYMYICSELILEFRRAYTYAQETRKIQRVSERASERTK